MHAYMYMYLLYMYMYLLYMHVYMNVYSSTHTHTCRNSVLYILRISDTDVDLSVKEIPSHLQKYSCVVYEKESS